MPEINFISLIYDFAVIGLVFAMIRRGMTEGFTRSFVRIAGYALVAVAAIVVSRIGAVFIYRAVMEPKLISMLEESILSTGNAEQLFADLQAALESLPAVSFIIFDLAGMAEGGLEGLIGESAGTIAGAVVDGVISPVIGPILKSAIFIIVFIIGCLVVNAVARGSGVIQHIPLVGGIDRFFGGALGIAEGVLTAAVLSMFIYVALACWEGRWSWLSRDVISDTFIFRWIYAIATGDESVI